SLPRHGVVGSTPLLVALAFPAEPLAPPTPDLLDDIVYNRDVAKAIALAAFAPRPTHWQFNISSETLISQRAFAEEVMRHCPNHRLTIAENEQAGQPGTVPLFSNPP